MHPPASLAGLTLSFASDSYVACMARTASDCPSACASEINNEINNMINARDPADFFSIFSGNRLDKMGFWVYFI